MNKVGFFSSIVLNIILLFTVPDICLSQTNLLISDSAIPFVLLNKKHVINAKLDTSTLSQNIIDIKCNPIDGHWVQYYINGVKALEYSIKDKNVNGLLKFYYPNGICSTIIKVKNNIREGASKHYYRSGNIWLKSSWKNGKYSGKWKYYNDFGETYMIREYKDDTLIKKTIFYEIVTENDDINW